MKWTWHSKSYQQHCKDCWHWRTYHFHVHPPKVLVSTQKHQNLIWVLHVYGTILHEHQQHGRQWYIKMNKTWDTEDVQIKGKTLDQSTWMVLELRLDSCWCIIAVPLLRGQHIATLLSLLSWVLSKTHSCALIFKSAENKISKLKFDNGNRKLAFVVEPCTKATALETSPKCKPTTKLYGFVNPDRNEGVCSRLTHTLLWLKNKLTLILQPSGKKMNAYQNTPQVPQRGSIQALRRQYCSKICFLMSGCITIPLHQSNEWVSEIETYASAQQFSGFEAHGRGKRLSWLVSR